jgi:hypothetical protein
LDALAAGVGDHWFGDRQRAWVRTFEMNVQRVAIGAAVVFGALVLADFFIVGEPIDTAAQYVIRSASIVAAFALILGVFNISSVHLTKLVKQEKGWGYSIVLLTAMLVTIIVGFIGGGPGSQPMILIFDTVIFPLQATLFSLLAFFFVVATYRAFRVRSVESALFVVFGVIVLLGQTPVGSAVWEQLPVVKDWVFDVPALAGMRGILLGVALGTIATGLRVLVGVDRPYAD